MPEGDYKRGGHEGAHWERRLASGESNGGHGKIARVKDSHHLRGDTNRERERETETERERQQERWTEKETETKTKTEREREKRRRKKVAKGITKREGGRVDFRRVI